VHAADLRSFTIAGRQLGVSSSAVGKAIARLEQKVGVRLFHRSTRTITLTPEGATFLGRCRGFSGRLRRRKRNLRKRAVRRGADCGSVCR
jgi:DNA-binding transcriptional LysR family regulator